MSLSSPFIRRPAATTLLTVAIVLAGAAGIRVSSRLGATSNRISDDRSGFSASGRERRGHGVLRRNTARKAVRADCRRYRDDVVEFSRRDAIALQFDLDRDIDGAARDVQAAINAARKYLPSNLPSNPTYRKVNPAEAPIMILALTSKIYDRGRDVRRGLDDHRTAALADPRRGSGHCRRKLAAGSAGRAPLDSAQ